MRPVHPACTSLSHSDACQCETLWQGWDGSVDSLERLIDAHERLEYKRRGNVRGHAPDDCNDAAKPGLDSLANDSNDLDVEGFWKESEFLKTVRGN